MSDKIEIKIGTATCGNAAGAQKTLAKILELTKGNDNIIVRETGCIGLCHAEPVVEVKMNGEKILYGDVDDKKFEVIFDDSERPSRTHSPVYTVTIRPGNAPKPRIEFGALNP